MMGNDQIPDWCIKMANSGAKEKEKAREQQIRTQLAQLAQLQAQIEERREASTPSRIPEQIFLKPLHADPAHHLELLSVLMFRTRFSEIPMHEQNLHTKGLMGVPLLEMFGKMYLERICWEYGVEFGKLQSLVDELWVSKVFSPMSCWMKELRRYTDEDVESDRFRKAVGLWDSRIYKASSGDEVGKFTTAQSRTLQWLDTQTKSNVPDQQQQPNRQLVSPPKPKPKLSLQNASGAGPKAAPTGSHKQLPPKSSMSKIVSGFSRHGGPKNIYNPSVLRRPKAPLVPSHISTQPQSTHRQYSARLRSGTANSSKQDTTNRHLSVSTSDVSRTGSSGSFKHPQSKHNNSAVESRPGIVSADSHRPDTINSHSSNVTFDACFDGEPMDIDMAPHTNRANASLVPSHNSAGSTQSNVKLGSKSGSGVARSSRRDHAHSRSSAVTSAIHDMRSKRSGIVKRLRRSRRSLSGKKNCGGSVEGLGVSTMKEAEVLNSDRAVSISTVQDVWESLFLCLGQPSLGLIAFGWDGWHV
ncbi:hypothetical protein SBOR_0135 [Sclerotinia borealis F-4128]|uniref:Uncharacterized protein n=1 Tax=Sclerotinia borealis (strain F-4128) TaxID=1432307 RepID=W9CRQ7_SCLBF|nr:hypothetical protein SBOR_0135 [Sclerotinia borealis F-4128]